MRTDKLTTLAQEAIQNAQSQANLAGHGELTPLHLLLAVVEEKNGIASSILQRAGVDANRVRKCCAWHGVWANSDRRRA